MRVLDVWVRDDDTVKLEIEDQETLPVLRGDQAVRREKNVYTASGITFDFNTETAIWDDEKLIISPLQVDELKEWFEKHADRANMEMVKPTLEKKLPGDVVKEIGKYGGKKKRKTRKLRKVRKSKRRTTRKR